MKFAKLFDLEDKEQVLITVEENEERDCYELHIRTDFDGVVATMKLGFEEEQSAIDYMEKIDLQSAIELRKKLCDIIIS